LSDRRRIERLKLIDAARTELMILSQPRSIENLVLGQVCRRELMVLSQVRRVQRLKLLEIPRSYRNTPHRRLQRDSRDPRVMLAGHINRRARTAGRDVLAYVEHVAVDERVVDEL